MLDDYMWCPVDSTSLRWHRRLNLIVVSSLIMFTLVAMVILGRLGTGCYRVVLEHGCALLGWRCLVKHACQLHVCLLHLHSMCLLHCIMLIIIVVSFSWGAWCDFVGCIIGSLWLVTWLYAAWLHPCMLECIVDYLIKCIIFVGWLQELIAYARLHAVMCMCSWLSIAYASW